MAQANDQNPQTDIDHKINFEVDEHNHLQISGKITEAILNDLAKFIKNDPDIESLVIINDDKDNIPTLPESLVEAIKENTGIYSIYLDNINMTNEHFKELNDQAHLLNINNRMNNDHKKENNVALALDALEKGKFDKAYYYWENAMKPENTEEKAQALTKVSDDDLEKFNDIEKGQKHLENKYTPRTKDVFKAIKEGDLDSAKELIEKIENSSKERRRRRSEAVTEIFAAIKESNGANINEIKKSIDTFKDEFKQTRKAIKSAIKYGDFKEFEELMEKNDGKLSTKHKKYAEKLVENLIKKNHGEISDKIEGAINNLDTLGNIVEKPQEYALIKAAEKNLTNLTKGQVDELTNRIVTHISSTREQTTQQNGTRTAPITPQNHDIDSGQSLS